jgi:SAM-dependent methyltransferase
MKAPTDPFESLRPIIAEHGVTMSAREFHSVVDEVFHAFEASVYDEVHKDMWRSLPEQFDLLASDLLALEAWEPKTVSLLDVGCGTGLATELLLNTAVGPAVKRVTMLDPSKEMLKRAHERSRRWGIDVEGRQEYLRDMPGGATFDLAVACSVLHHVPDLSVFGSKLSEVVRLGGFFLHIHDPNGDAAGSEPLRERVARLDEMRGPRTAKARLRPRHIVGKIKSIFPWLDRREYLDRVNKELKRRGVIRSSLSAEEIWRITDIRVYDDRGVRIEDLSAAMPTFDLVSQRSYGFFGRLGSELPHGLRDEEGRLSAQRDPSGSFLGAVWRRGS